MALDDVIRRFSATSVTAGAEAEVTLEAAETLAATSVTAVTAAGEDACGETGEAACTLEWLRKQGCHVLPDDVRFIDARLPQGTRRRNATLRAYVATWLAAMEREPVEHRKAGRGRFAANTALLEGRLALEVRYGKA